MTSKNCLVCAEAIPTEAKKCKHCESFQSWKRHLNISSTILSLLVALVAVLGVTTPVLKDAFENKFTEFTSMVSSREIKPINRVDKEIFNILITNIGTKGGAVSEVYLEIDKQKIRANLPSKYMERHDYFIEPNKTVILPYYIDIGDAPKSGYKLIVHYIGHDNNKKSIVIMM